MESLHFIGHIESTLKTMAECPLQESEGAPQAVVVIDKKYQPAILGLEKGSNIIVFTWLDKGVRETLVVRPRNNSKAAFKGVFATRSNDRPNPIGIHVTEILSINEDGRILVSNIEVLDGTPVIDIKPVI
jgi:tRNA-Thr(GGU) m(6)t(6)A37 methyltransferase TsaA